MQFIHFDKPFFHFRGQGIKDERIGGIQQCFENGLP